MTTPKHAGIAGSNLFDTYITPVHNDRTGCKLPEIPSYLTPFHHTWHLLAFASKVTSMSMHINLMNIECTFVERKRLKFTHILD